MAKVTAEVEVKVKGGDEVKETEEKFKSFKTRIRETMIELQKLEEAGTTTGKEYEKLRDKLDDLNDAQDRAKFKAGQFEDKLAALPGPIGQIGGGLKTAGDAVATFGKTLTISLGIIGLMVTAFFAIKDALGKTKEGQEGLSKAFEAFNKILSPIFAILEKIGLAVLPIVTKGFEALGSVMNKVAGFFGVTQDKIKEVQGTLQKDNEYKNKLDEEEKKRLEGIQKKKDEDAKKHQEWLDKKKAADAKAAEERKKRAEEEKKNLDDANKVLNEAFIGSLDERNAEIFKRGQKLNEDIVALQKAGIKDLSSVKESYNRDVDKINKKYDDEEAKKKEDEKKKAEDDAKKLKEDAEKEAADKLEKENKLREDAATLLQADFDLKRANNEATFQDQRDLFEKTRALGLENLKANNANADAITAYEKETAAMRIQNKKDEEAVKLDAVSGALSAVATLVDQNTVAGKAISVAQAVINTYQGATKALSAYPPPFNFIAAAATVASGLMSVQKILSTEVPSIKGGGSVASGGGSINTAPPTYSAPQGLSTPQITTQGGANPATQISQTIANAQQQPVRAYVVSQDISSQQVLDRKTNRAATFGLG
jgi:hypothetical protein